MQRSQHLLREPQNAVQCIGCDLEVFGRFAETRDSGWRNGVMCRQNSGKDAVFFRQVSCTSQDSPARILGGRGCVVGGFSHLHFTHFLFMYIRCRIFYNTFELNVAVFVLKLKFTLVETNMFVIKVASDIRLGAWLL